MAFYTYSLLYPISAVLYTVRSFQSFFSLYIGCICLWLFIPTPCFTQLVLYTVLSYQSYHPISAVYCLKLPVILFSLHKLHLLMDFYTYSPCSTRLVLCTVGSYPSYHPIIAVYCAHTCTHSVSTCTTMFYSSSRYAYVSPPSAIFSLGLVQCISTSSKYTFTSPIAITPFPSHVQLHFLQLHFHSHQVPPH